jgi:regulator of sirC expression with transglutaminase-like and TPR domain
MSPTLRLGALSTLEYFETLVAEDASLPLLEAAISLAQDEFPGLDVQAVLADVDALAVRLRQRLAADASPTAKLRLLNKYFFQELGFAGNVNNFYDMHNSFVHQVLSRRRGIPISLALIYMELAGQIGLLARGIAFPGHFLVRLRMTQGEVVIDPFSGKSLSRDQLEELLLPYRQSLLRREGETGAQPAPQSTAPLTAFLQAATPREVLARMLRNLKEIHRSNLDWGRALAVMHRLVLLQPDDMNERRDRGLVFEQLGEFDAAAADYAAYLEQCPDATDHGSVRQRLLALRGDGRYRLH